MTDHPPSAADGFGLPPTLPAPAGVNPPPDERQRRLLLVGGLAAGFLAVLALAWFGTQWVRGNQNPTPAPTVPSGMCIDVNGTLVPCASPVTLEVLGRLYSVQSQEPLDGQWPYFPKYPEYASWVRGTVVNYVLGVAVSDDNTRLFSELQAGDAFTLTLENDTQLIYHFDKYTESSDTAQIFRQQEPGLTLVLLGQEGDKKPVVTATWAATLPGASSGPPGYPMGTPVATADALITVLSSQYLNDPSLGLPEGSGYFRIDYTLTYTGAADLLDTQLFDFTLVDNNRIEYQPSGSVTGRFPQATGQIAPGETLTATVGYLVDALPGRTVAWRVRLRPTDPSDIVFAVPFTALASGDQARIQAVVSVTAVDISPDRTSLYVSGLLTNPSGETLNVQVSDLLLSSGVAQSPLTGSEPPLPWQVPSGGQLPFRITFLKPPTQTVVFSLLGRSFALNNIP
jgi:hypothetical protein